MTLHRTELPSFVLAMLAEGIVIPAHPLALDDQRRFDRGRQRALTRYYVDAGAGGLAVGVHTTQFNIRENGLYETVLRAAMEDQLAWAERPMVMIAGICGNTKQAIKEAKAAVDIGYHAGLLNLAGLASTSEEDLISHCEAVSRQIPLFGFYLQAAVNGPTLSRSFWSRFAKITNVLGIKVAPFNRYQTIDVVHGLVDARAEDRVFLYTGNDDHIILDLTVPFTVMREGKPITVRFRGGLLGHWSVWTSTAVSLHACIKKELSTGNYISNKLLALDSRITDCNSAFFDVANNFKGCIAGCHEVLFRQGLLVGTWCLDPTEELGPGQYAEIDRVYREHADLCDDTFVESNLLRWLS